MKIVLIKDVYKLGRAGEIKKVAAGYGRNYLIPRGFAIQATLGAIQQSERIKVKATERRAVLNEELGSVAEVLDGIKLSFAVKAGETGRLYGSVSDDDILVAIHENFEIDLEKRQVETEPIRSLGTFQVPIHLTMDLMPTITVIVHREGELPGEEETQEEADIAVEKVDEGDVEDLEVELETAELVEPVDASETDEEIAEEIDEEEPLETEE